MRKRTSVHRVTELQTLEVFFLSHCSSWLAGSREGTVAGTSGRWKAGFPHSPWNKRHLNLCSSWQQCLAWQTPPVPIAHTFGQWCPAGATLGQFSLPSAREHLGASTRLPVRSCWAQLAGLPALLQLPTRFSAGKQGGHSLCCPRAAEPVSERCPCRAVRVAPARHIPQGTTAGTLCRALGPSSALSPPGRLGYTVLAILKNSSAASRAMSRSCQTAGIVVTAGCSRHIPARGPPSTAALRLSKALELIFSHLVDRMQEHPVAQNLWRGVEFMVLQHWHFQGNRTDKLQVQHLPGSPQMLPHIRASSGSPTCSPSCELPAELGWRGEGVLGVLTTTKR